MLRRRRSWSESSSSSQAPDILSSHDGSTMPSTFMDTGLQTCPMEFDNCVPTKKSRIDKPEDSPMSEDESEEALFCNPRTGKHYLQRVADKTTTLIRAPEQSSTVYISNLDAAVTEHDIKKLFSECSGLIDVRVFFPHFYIGIFSQYI